MDARVIGSAADVAAKQSAMVAHATQLWVAVGSAGDVIDTPRTSADGAPVPFCLSNLITQPLLGTESFMLGERRDGESGLSGETLNRLDCLFAEGR